MDADNTDEDLAVTLRTRAVDSGTLYLDGRTGIILYTPRAHFHGVETINFTVLLHSVGMLVCGSL